MSPRPLSSVQLPIARFGVIVSDFKEDGELAAWARSFHRALALQDRTLNDFAAELIDEAEGFRRKDKERKIFHGKNAPSKDSKRRGRNPAESNGIRRNPRDSK